jgi:hypothetical protein
VLLFLGADGARPWVIEGSALEQAKAHALQLVTRQLAPTA